MIEEAMDKDGSPGVAAKVCAILREIAQTGGAGARLTDLTTGCRCSRPTVRRILIALMAEGFVQQTDRRRYCLTPLVHEIGLSAPSPVGNLDALFPVVQALSDACGDTVYLSRRNGSNAYYLLRGEGAFPIRTYVVQPHQALHLVSCHSGRALLAAMRKSESHSIIDRAWAEDRNLFNAATRESLLEEIDFAREHGFAWARDVTFSGVAGLSMVVPNPYGQPYLAVTISCISQRLPFDRIGELLPLLKKTAADIRSLIDRDLT